MKAMKILIITLTFLPLISYGGNGQRHKKHTHTKYKYEYRVHLTNFPSTYSLIQKDSNLNGKCMLNFIISNKTSTLPFSSVKIHSNNLDTVFNADIDGFASTAIRSDTTNFIIVSPGFVELKLESIPLKSNTLYEVQVLMSQHKSQHIAIIHSQRKLTGSELVILIENLSNEQEENNILFTKKICFISWEI